MDTKVIAEYYLNWLKNNLGRYRYRTEEARKLKAEMQRCPLKTEEDIGTFAAYYQEFVRMLECNPLNATDREGKDAAIRAEGFRYLFLKNNDGIDIPIEIFLKSLSSSDTEKRQQFYNRIEDCLGLWISDQAKNKKKVEEEFASGAAEIAATYGSLLNRKSSSAGFWFRQLIMLVLLAASIFQLVLGIQDHAYDLSGAAESINSYAFLFAGGLTCLFAWKSIGWIRNEHRRITLLNDWVRCVHSVGAQQTQTTTGFRDAARLEEILKREILMAREIDTDTSQEDDRGDIEEQIDFSKFLDKKNIRLVNTIRPLHLFVMALALICLTIASPVKFSGQAEELITQARTKLDEIEQSDAFVERVAKTHSVSDTMSQLDLESEIGLVLRTAVPSAQLLDMTDGRTVLAEYEQTGQLLYPYGCSYDLSQNCLWYQAVDVMGNNGYIRADSCILEDQLEQTAGSLTVLDANGQTAQRADVSSITDGQAATAGIFFTGDTLVFDYSYGCRFQYIYLVNGNGLSDGTGDSHGRAQKIKITFDQTTEYYAELQDNRDSMGTFIRIPDETASSVQIQLVEATEDADTIELSELKLCGTRMR